MEVSAFTHGVGGSGVRLPSQNRNQLSDGDKVTIFIRKRPGQYEKFSLTIKTAGGSCPELRHKKITEWLIGLGFLDLAGRPVWKRGNPSKFYLTHLDQKFYILEPI
jgi:hypothetical protein